MPKTDPRALTCVSLFAGACGMALGFEQAGLDHLLLNEFDRHAVATLRANRPAWNVDSRDIHDISFLHLRGAVDVVEGGFPCQAFSASGNRQGFADPRGTLFFEFARAVREIHPKLAIAENVKGLRSHDGGRTLRTMVASLEEAGYQVAWRVLDASRFGVPQRRGRLILFALHRSVRGQIVFPIELDSPAPTVRQAIGDRPEGPGQRYSASREAIMRHVPEGGNWRDLPAEVLATCLPNGPYQGGSCSGVARRLAWDEPSPTLLCSPVAKLTERCHPSETRPLNVREYARIQTFPDGWQFAGPVAAQYRQIGNAVPVALAYHLGQTARAMLSATGPERHSCGQTANTRRRVVARRSLGPDRKPLRTGRRVSVPQVGSSSA